MNNILQTIRFSQTSLEARGVYGSVTAPPIRAGKGVSMI